jgi:phage major head subunit gpT-like protein
MSATMIDRAKVEAAFVMFSTVFDMKLKNTPTVYDQIATVINGVSEQVQFKWLSSVPTMRKWIGDRTMQRLRGETMTLTTDWWANGIEVDVDDMNNEAKLGMIAKRISSMATAAARKLDDQVVQYYISGFAGTLGVTYDGQYLFDIDHTAAGNGLGTQQSNLLAGGVTSANINTGITNMMLFTDDEGDPIASVPRKILAGPKQQLALRQVLKQEYNAAGASNPDANLLSFLLSPRITGTHWFMLADEEIKPVVLGIEVAPQFVAADNPALFEMFSRRNALYGSHLKFGLCYGLWQAGAGSLG